MKKSIISFIIGLMIAMLGGCTVKGYSGPELPIEQTAEVRLKAPATATIPLFWIFPLNMLNWLADDWFETSLTFSDIVLITHDDTNEVLGEQILDRFTTVRVNVGRWQKVSVLGNDVSVPKRWGCDTLWYYGQSKECEPTRGKPPNEEGNILVQTLCSAEFITERGKSYLVFIRDGKLTVDNGKYTVDATCHQIKETD
ncbi:hypothetical protein [Methylomonas sp. AM2-LC]|uniref:hypothetical protein n=1 Tax=Methylomonas sp. AM2-LC TaxID=3153301 RepID=UPI003267A600